MEEYKIIVEKTIRDLFKSTNLSHIKNYKKIKESEIEELNNKTKSLVLEKYPLLVSSISNVKNIQSTLKELEYLKTEVNNKIEDSKINSDLTSVLENPKNAIIHWSNCFQSEFLNQINLNNNCVDDIYIKSNDCWRQDEDDKLIFKLRKRLCDSHTIINDNSKHSIDAVLTEKSNDNKSPASKTHSSNKYIYEFILLNNKAALINSNIDLLSKEEIVNNDSNNMNNTDNWNSYKNIDKEYEKRLWKKVERTRISNDIYNFFEIIKELLNIRLQSITKPALYANKEKNIPKIKEDIILSELFDFLFKLVLTKNEDKTEVASNNKNNNCFNIRANNTEFNSCFSNLISVFYLFLLSNNKLTLLQCEGYQRLISDKQSYSIFSDSFKQLNELIISIKVSSQFSRKSNYEEYLVNSFFLLLNQCFSLLMKFFLIEIQKELGDFNLNNMIFIIIKHLLLINLLNINAINSDNKDSNKDRCIPDYLLNLFSSFYIFNIRENNTNNNNDNKKKKSVIELNSIINNLQNKESKISELFFQNLANTYNALHNSLKSYFNYFKKIINKDTIKLIKKSFESQSTIFNKSSSNSSNNELFIFEILESINKQMVPILNYNSKYCNDIEDNSLIFSIKEHVTNIINEIILLNHNNLINENLSISKNVFNLAKNVYHVKNYKKQLIKFYEIVINKLSNINDNEENKENNIDSKDFWKNIYHEMIERLLLFNTENTKLTEISTNDKINDYTDSQITLQSLLIDISSCLKAIIKEQVKNYSNDLIEIIKDSINKLEDSFLTITKKKLDYQLKILEKEIAKINIYLYHENYENQNNSNNTSQSINEIMNKVVSKFKFYLNYNNNLNYSEHMVSIIFD